MRDCRDTGTNATQEFSTAPRVIQQFFADWGIDWGHSAIGAWGSNRLVPYQWGTWG
jgi:hypothetical protein